MNGLIRRVALMLSTVAMISFIGLSAAQGASPKALTGVVTDVACGISHSMMKGSGTDAECVRSCVKGGSAFGLVVGDKVYTLRDHSAELNKYAARKVTVRGAMHGNTFVVQSVAPAK